MTMIQDLANRMFWAGHPALRAWSEIAGKDFAPVDVQILAERSNSKVYRLIGVGPDGSNVIAKRYPAANARAEYRTYEEVLCHLPLNLLHHHGLVQEGDTGFCWAFVEDAAGDEYSPEIQQHTIEAAEWLALLHTSAQGVARSVDLPDRNPGYYFDCLRAGRDRISRRLAGSPLHEDGRVILGFLAAQCDAVQASWERIERLCSGAPQTLVHADLSWDNVHVRTRPDGITLMPFDWECAGWGVPAIDLALEGIDLRAYCSIVKTVWPGFDVRTARALAIAGRLFQLCALIEWESRGLGSEWLRRPMKHMAYYGTEMSDTMRSIERETSR